jgi:hypothetical protein
LIWNFGMSTGRARMRTSASSLQAAARRLGTMTRRSVLDTMEASISEDDRAKIGRGNALKLFRLPV